jgi:hypothetical protein
MRSAFTDARGFPLTRIVNVSSFSVVMRLPNQDFLVSSGEDSGVRCTSSDEAIKKSADVNTQQQSSRISSPVYEILCLI